MIVAFGDSLTEGIGTTAGANRRYPDVLSGRLGSTVLNVGIGGNRLLRDGYGQAGLLRFQRDVLDVPGATHVIIALGTNDIGLATAHDTPQPGAAQLIEGLGSLAQRARAAGLVPVGATLPPTGDTIYPGFHTEAGAKIRVAVNEWVRATADFAGVLDMDLAVRDPARPTHYLPAFDSGDHLHPNDAGAAAFAHQIDLAVFA